MSDFDTESHAFDAQFVDPYVTRLVRRDPTSAPARLLERCGPVATSVSFVVPDDEGDLERFADALGRWNPRGLRLEVLAAGSVDDIRRAQGRCDDEAIPVAWRSLGRPMGGRAAVLAEAAAAVEHEFVALVTSDDVPFDGLTAALGHMWADGCDAALVDAADVAVADTGGSESSVDAAAELAAWLGPVGLRGPGRLVVLRRWVARWVFHEVTRAIEPWVEVADRCRLLGIGIVHQGAVAAHPRSVATEPVRRVDP